MNDVPLRSPPLAVSIAHALTSSAATMASLPAPPSSEPLSVPPSKANTSPPEPPARCSTLVNTTVSVAPESAPVIDQSVSASGPTSVSSPPAPSIMASPVQDASTVNVLAPAPPVRMALRTLRRLMTCVPTVSEVAVRTMSASRVTTIVFDPPPPSTVNVPTTAGRSPTVTSSSPVLPAIVRSNAAAAVIDVLSPEPSVNVTVTLSGPVLVTLIWWSAVSVTDTVHAPEHEPGVIVIGSSPS